MAISVVSMSDMLDLPAPVTPVTRNRPRLFSARFSRIGKSLLAANPKSENEEIAGTLQLHLSYSAATVRSTSD